MTNTPDQILARDDATIRSLLRPPSHVMRLARMGRFFPTRLSFMAVLLRRISSEGWNISQTQNALDADGYGYCVYRAETSPATGGRCYSLIAFTQPLADADRSDRVIAQAWDAAFVLFDGEPDENDIARLAQNAPRQEAGRYSARELVLSRANKSVRFFSHCVDRLAAGAQPDPDLLRSVGYLMRTTAVYGNGKFGIADRGKIEDRPELSGSFAAEMLTVYLIRQFTIDLIEHIARAKSPDTACALEPAHARMLGIGNSTGLGMAPFLVYHPLLLNNWIVAREIALARVRALESAGGATRDAFLASLPVVQTHLDHWRVDAPHHMARIEQLRRELAAFSADPVVAGLDWSAGRPWHRLMTHAEQNYGDELQELLISLVLEPHGEIVDELADCMTAPAEPRLDATMPAGQLKALVETHYGWALGIDMALRESQALFWYVSEEKLEPRLGMRFEEPGGELESPLAIARDVQDLHRALSERPPDQPIAHLALARPALRAAMRRTQIIATAPYGEINDNLIGATTLPIDLLRCKLSFFGASRFDPKSDRWTRITMYRGAPLADDLRVGCADGWYFHEAAAQP